MQAPKATFSPQRPASTLKLCADCKFYKPVITRQSGLCTLCGEIDLVTGKKQHMLASQARKQKLCGEDGKYYVAGPSQPAAFMCKEDAECISAVTLVSLFSAIFICVWVFLVFESLKRTF